MRLTSSIITNGLTCKHPRRKRLADFCRSISTLWFAVQVMFPLIAPAATIVVTNKGDDANPGTLRNALANAANGDTIDASGISGIISLTNGELFVGNSLTITGPGPSTLAVRGSGGSPVFTIRADAPVTISGLTITHFSFPGINPS